MIRCALLATLAISSIGCATRAPPEPNTIAAIKAGAAQAQMEDCLKQSFQERFRYVPAIELWQLCEKAAYGHTSMRQPADR